MSARALWTAAEAEAATGGRASGKWAARGVSIDSRTLAPGDLFVALKGPSHDGHAFVAEALAAGAAAAMVARPPEGLAAGAPLLAVPDTLTALGALGAAARTRARARIVAVTGSAGKTSTKEALRLVLSRQGETAASAKSFNNHWGVPLSLARMPPDAAFGVFEIGMNHAGEIAPLSRLVRPHVALITNVAAAHTEFFAGLEDVADAKAEIFAGVAPGGAAVLNRDNPFFDRLAAAARACGIARIVGFGASAEAEARLISAVADAGGSQIEAELGGRRLAFRIGAPGAHWVSNALAALAAAEALGADVAAASEALAEVGALEGRGRAEEIPFGGGHITLIDDSYNANPASMRAALALLGAAAPGPGGRRVAVLGGMRELGASSAAEHAALAEPLRAAGADLVFTAGELIRPLHAALPGARLGGHAIDAGEAARQVAAVLRPGDVVLVKGSFALGMGRVVAALRRRACAACG